uniref:enoyl-CoA hydratase-related protein n=1 Tax=unclassified Variovorax TaxID=663243 RepID=UPI000D360A01
MPPTEKPLRILLLCHAFNGLSQRLFVELGARGHEVSVELDISDAVTAEAVALFAPDLLIAPYLKRLIPAAVWQRLPCLVVHPGPVGDRGPAALDHAVLEGCTEWGVTVLQADGEFDAGPALQAEAFALRAAAKGSLYRREVTEAAVRCTLRAVAHFAAPDASLHRPAAPSGARGWRAAVDRAERLIDWARDDTALVLRKIRSADGHPGVEDSLFGLACRLYDAHPATPGTLAALPDAAPGALLGQRDGALLRRTSDGAVWIGQASRADVCGPRRPFKLPCTLAFADEAAGLAPLPAPLEREAADWGELRYAETGPPGGRVGCLYFEFHNGAMSTGQCERLLEAVRSAQARDTRVLLLLGGADFFANGIHLNCIEAAAHRPGDSAADESWRNIQAMDDVALALITTTDRLTVSALRGNAGAGGAFLALCADEVWAHPGVVLNPHYRNMGNLFGSEYWTYLLPRRLGDAGAAELMTRRLPIGARQAEAAGLIDRCMDVSAAGFEAQAITHAVALATAQNVGTRIEEKQRRRRADEAQRPLAEYRHHELTHMHRNFYGFDPSFHVARYHFVHKLPMAWTPRHLARHRELAPAGGAGAR